MLKRNIYDLSEILGVSTDYLLKGKEPNIPGGDNPEREKYIMFLLGLSDQELAITVRHAEVTLNMCIK